MDDNIKFLLQAAKEASDRARWVILVLQITAIVVMTASWNTGLFEWSQARSRFIQVALWQSQHQALCENCDRAAKANCNRVTCCPGQNAPFTDNEIGNAQKYLQRYKYTTQQLEHLWRGNQSFRIEHYSNISIPVLGISIDVNDVGLLGGVAFGILLLVLTFSLRRELANLEILFDYARGFDRVPDKRRVYEFMSTSQVLSLPKMPRNTFITLPFDFLPRALLVVPAMVQVWITVSNFSTREIAAQLLGSPLATIHVFLTVAACVAVVLLAALCFVLSAVITGVWEKAYKDFFGPPAVAGAKADSSQIK